MKKPVIIMLLFVICVLGIQPGTAALVVPNEVQQPGTQPGEIARQETADKCDNCHGSYDQAVEPVFNWRGSMMANAGRDPIFWASMAIAEQDYDGAGDFCLRCHSPLGWFAGRSTPTDGSKLRTDDADGVNCDTCHMMTNPDNTELLGEMFSPFVANEGTGAGYYGSGMLSMWGGDEKLGPYSDADPPHKFIQSSFHRDVDFCGSCHDVSDPVTGDIAHNNGAQSTADPVISSGVIGDPVDTKAAFNNFPYQYGIVERTFSEYIAGALSRTLVSDYASLPENLQAGAIQAAYESALGNYEDGTPRYFSCQTCHVPATTGVGCSMSGVPVRSDLPLHDMTGGNYWAPDAILYQESQDLLRLGGGLSDTQIAAINAGKLRAQQQLNLSASLQVSGDTLTVVNLTGHKLISGYPEGRRMWLNIKWYDATSSLLREDGKYDIVTTISGTPVKSIVNLNDPNTKIYEALYGMTQEWANQLLSLGYLPDMPLGYDRITGNVAYTLGQLAAQPPGTEHETFHFVLNNTILKDNRIPPYGMSYDEARVRNALPTPATQYGNPGAGGTFDYWDEVPLNPPVGAAYAEIKLLYQPTSWEYIQFLYLDNNGENEFLGLEGVNLLETWLNTGMAEPYVMASTSWGGSSTPPGDFNKISPTNGATSQATSVALDWGDSTGAASYEYCLDTSDDGACSTNWINTGASSGDILSGLSTGSTYYWQVRAVNAQGSTYADGSPSDYWVFSTGSPPGAFDKISPSNGLSGLPLDPTLAWSASSGASSYEYCYDTSDDNSCTEWLSAGSATSVQLNPLAYGTTYYWQVRAVNSFGTSYANGSTTAFWSFTTGSLPGAFGKVHPGNGATGQLLSLSLTWSTSDGALSYEYCYDTTDDNTCSNWVNTSTTTSAVIANLFPGTTYFWQVRAINSFGMTYANDSSSAYWSFTTGLPPANFNKISPGDGAVDQPLGLTLSWNNSTGASSYEACYDTTDDHECDGAWTSTGLNTSLVISGLSDATAYYWQVRALNAIGSMYADSETWWSFTTREIVPHTIYLPMVVK